MATENVDAEKAHERTRRTVLKWGQKTTDLTDNMTLGEMVKRSVELGRCRLAVELLLGIDLRKPPQSMAREDLLLLDAMAKGTGDGLIMQMAQPENHSWDYAENPTMTEGCYRMLVYPGEWIVFSAKVAREIGNLRRSLGTNAPIGDAIVARRTTILQRQQANPAYKRAR
ncbi:MAG: hypothetical protein COY66_04105 [Candidatus Kerfeldbacteria bacterium CG_4_10_14_0_8_um_filter_42_10]|uniref:Uncharacterized protein n=1 Tax=Candidatus Kerfeldbacteria bacterium CG_4_10_14_0_8_um_filter_42_10 TaxID=2014248 RepID=A0A2M7RIT2_9BACT|nr:MAG: hypothetical protein COY66_04105 [Candidatus Kerfeldbacteria bacterium CG_4_10_14_0_8_um_filter_42_10]